MNAPETRSRPRTNGNPLQDGGWPWEHDASWDSCWHENDRSDNADRPLAGQRVALVDLLDRLLAGGVVLVGDIVIGIADVDLVHISLRALVTSLGTEAQAGAEPWRPM